MKRCFYKPLGYELANYMQESASWKASTRRCSSSQEISPISLIPNYTILSYSQESARHIFLSRDR